MTDSHIYATVNSPSDREDSSDTDEVHHNEYSLATAVEPHYASPEKTTDGNGNENAYENSDDEGKGGSRRRESQTGSVSEKSERSQRESIKRRDSNDDDDDNGERIDCLADDEDGDRHNIKEDNDFYEAVEENTEGNTEGDYYNQEERGKASGDSDAEEHRPRSDSANSRNSRNSRRDSEVREIVVEAHAEHHEEITNHSERKSESGSDEHEKSDEEHVYDELDVRDGAGELREELREEPREELREEHEQDRRKSRESDSDTEDDVRRRSSSAEDVHDAPKRTPTTPTAGSGPSGKFVLRTVRNADPLHVLRNIHKTQDNPETDELVTILRSQGQEREEKEKYSAEEKAKQERLKSFLTSKLVHKFEQGIESVTEQQNDVDDSATTVVVHETKYKTTVVKATVKDPTPLSPKSPISPKSPNLVGGYQGVSYVSYTQHQKQGLNGQETKSVSVTTSRTGTGNNDPPKTPVESGVPIWKTEIDARKKTMNHVPAQKPREPMKMSEVPEWKRQLQEKNKMKKVNSNEETEFTLSKILLNPSAASLPLKVEMDRLKREMCVQGKATTVVDKPEWAVIADGMKKPIQHPDINGNTD